jgi:hypothetical protein
MRTERSKSPPASTPGVISQWEIYSLDEVKGRLRWTDSALRAARRKGLNVLKCGKRTYISGQEIARFLSSISTGTAAAQA